jgi:hypothetical protein
MIQEYTATTQADGRPCHCPHDAVFAGTQNARAMRSWRFPHRFQMKTWEARQCLMESRSQQVSPEKKMSETENAVMIPGGCRWQDCGMSAQENCRQLGEASPRERPCGLQTAKP